MRYYECVIADVDKETD